MNILKSLSKTQPVLFSIIVVMVSIAALYSTLLLNIENEISRDLVSSVIKNLITISLVFVIIKLGLLKGSLLITPYSNWHSKWWVATIPMTLFAFLNIASIDWSLLEFSTANFTIWVYTNLSTGLFEEILLRGICFYILFSAWKNKSNALVKAAICQGLIFGLAHYVNLTKAPFIEVSIQVAYSTLIGIGFAGLVAYTRSLWPAIGIHFFVNSLASINNYFHPSYIQEQMQLINYLVIIVIITLTCTVPGYLLLKKAQNAFTNLPLSSH